MSNATARTIPTSFLNNLQGAGIDQLQTAYNIAEERLAAAVRGSRSAAIWMTKRERIDAEIERRGFVAFKLDLQAQANDHLVVRLAEYHEIRAAQQRRSQLEAERLRWAV